MSALTKDDLILNDLAEYRPADVIAQIPELVTRLPIGVQIDDLRNRTVYVNDGFTKMLGWELADIAECDDWFSCAYPEPAYREQVKRGWAESLARALATNADIGSQEWVVACKNGERKVIEFHIRQIGDYYIYLHIDVSARHHLATELRRLANTDALTGVANRRRFFEAGAALLSSRRKPLALLIFDLDHFKSVNDEYGHAIGDQVLVEVVSRCRAVLGAEHLLARLGGEEFGVLLPACDEAGVVAVAERLRSAVVREPIAIASSVLEVTVSIGGACGGRDETDMDTILGRADRALYAAKRSGRNRTCFESIGP